MQSQQMSERGSRRPDEQIVQYSTHLCLSRSTHCAFGPSILDDAAAAATSRWKEGAPANVVPAKVAPVSGSGSRPTPEPDQGSRDDLEDKEELENLEVN